MSKGEKIPTAGLSHHIEQSSDNDLMILIRNGEEAAFREIMKRYQKQLLNFFYRSGANTNTAEDCVQEMFVKLYNYRNKFKPMNKFSVFLYTLARHTWLDELRRRKRLAVKNFLYGKFKAASGPKQESGYNIESALNKLSDKLRLVVVLSVYQGLNYDEIAEILNIPLGTVKSRMAAAFQLLREALKNDK